MKSKAIGYVRQSTTKQASLAWQEDIIRSEADKRSHRLERIFYDKASGGNSERTGLSLMKESITTKAVDFLYVWRLTESVETFLICWICTISAANTV